MVFHVFVNVGMTIGIMPVTGIPLPFLSAGGSFYLAMTLALGVANSVWYELNIPARTNSATFLPGGRGKLSGL
jgi:cell division protein FtsW (lipid II flippase)